MTSYPPQFDELYVVSDLHMGGERTEGRNFQMFDRGERLAAFVHLLAGREETADIALVLNGDIVDTLAERSVGGYVCLDARTALDTVKRICSDPSFAPVWGALAAFVQTPRRHLVFVVGNHDVELSLPIVEHWIGDCLSGGRTDARPRIHFSTHGAGFACQVGGARVFCTHGNEVDEWNWVDHRALGQLANAMNAGRGVPASEWTPNAGTRLVVDVMNIVKERYPFVDVLKPEVAAVAAILLVLDGETFRRINLTDALPVLHDKIRGGLVTKHLLSAEASSLSSAPSGALAEETARVLLGPGLLDAVRERRQPSEREMLLTAGVAVAEGRRATDSITDGGTTETLGGWDLFAGWVGLVRREEALRRALADWLKNDATFDVGEKDDLFVQMSQRVSNEVDFVVTGHTHLTRAIRLGAQRYYYNCGTWARLLRLPMQAVRDQSVFEQKVWPILNARSMSSLDDARVPGPDGDVPLLWDRTNAVRIAARDGVVTGDLLRVSDGPNSAVELQPEPDAEPFRVPIP